MSAPTNTEVCRLEFDDGSGVDFATPADALFAICYGKPVLGLRGVVHLCRVTHTDAEHLVIDGEPAINHTEPEHGEVIWTREQLQERVNAAAADTATPSLHGEPDKTTIAAVETIVAGLED